MERVRDDGGGDRARMGDAEGAVVLERPDVIGGGAEARGEAVAASQVLVGREYRLCPGVELGDAAPSPRVAVHRHAPDGACLTVQILAADPDRQGDGFI